MARDKFDLKDGEVANELSPHNHLPQEMKEDSLSHKDKHDLAVAMHSTVLLPCREAQAKSPGLIGNLEKLIIESEKRGDFSFAANLQSLIIRLSEAKLCLDDLNKNSVVQSKLLPESLRNLF